MLVLSRKLGQRFKVGQDVRVTIVKIDRNSVRIGIEAPPEIRIYRHELWLEIQAENKAASEASVVDLPPSKEPSSSP